MRIDSPEDRLLRLIKGKYRKKTESGESAKKGDAASFSTEITKKVFLKSKILKPPFLNALNRVFIGVFVILTVYLAYSLLFPAEKDADSLIKQKTGSAVPGAGREEEALLPGAEDYSVYSKSIAGRDLFAAPFAERIKESLEPKIDVSKRFNLVGIIAGKEPQAIIEDKEMKKTHYLYKGQSISGVTVEDIGDGRAVLSYNGQEITLVL